MNGHPIAPVFTILRHVEAPVKIYNFRGVPASLYSVTWSIIADQWSTMKKMSHNISFVICLHFYVDPGGHPGGSRADSRGENIKEIAFYIFEVFSKYPGPGIPFIYTHGASGIRAC